MAREAAEQAMLEERRAQEEKERQKEIDLAFAKSLGIAIGGGNSRMMEYINPLYRSNGAGMFYVNTEFVSFAGGHLHLGGDFDIGMIRINHHYDSGKVWWFRGGASAKWKFFIESLASVGPYLTAGAGWYKDWTDYNIKSYSVPSFSVGAGFDFFLFLDVQYFVMPTDGRNAGYMTVKGGLSIPYLMFKEMSKEKK
jgi:hypothetical protein